MTSLFSKSLDRRSFLKKMSIFSSAIAITSFGACEALAEAIANRPIRRRIRTGSTEVDQAVSIYENAVSLMKGLPNTDPRSWLNQATLHGTASSFSFCQHGTPHFLSWHRAYLYHFERVCQALTGNDNFGLPYWNWTLDKDVPTQFLNNSSSLFESSRGNTSLFSLSEFTPSNLESILDNSNFIAFSSQLEGSPHNTAHSNISGVLGQANSPMDPLFWLHHCMVDYCWMDWNVNRENDNPSDSSWNEEEWDHFVDGNGDPISMTAGMTTILPLLSYQYEETSIGTTQMSILAAVRKRRDFNEIKKRVEAGGNVDFAIGKRTRIANRLKLSLQEGLNQQTSILVRETEGIISKPESKDRIFAAIDFAEAPPTNDFLVRVFVNYPEANKETGIEDIHYAGSFSFFGTNEMTRTHGTHHDHHPKFLVNLTDTIRNLKKVGQIEDSSNLTLKFVTVPFDEALEQPKEATLNLDKIDIIFSQVGITP